MRMQHEKALAELPAARKAVHDGAIAFEAIFGGHFVDHRQQNMVKANAVKLDALVVGKIALHDDARRKQRRQNNAAVLSRKICKVIAVLCRCPPRPVNDNDQFVRFGAVFIIVLGDIKTVTETLIDLTCKKRGRSEIVEAEFFAMALPFSSRLFLSDGHDRPPLQISYLHYRRAI